MKRNEHDPLIPSPLSPNADAGWPTVTKELSETAGRNVGHVFDAVLRSIEELSATVVDLVRERGRPGREELSPLRLEILGVLEGHAPLVTGTGFVAAPDVLADAPLWLEWWQAGDGPDPERLVVDLDPASLGFYDYTDKPWYTVPDRTRGAYVHGPYVDYHGTDQYILTMSAPVLSEPVLSEPVPSQPALSEPALSEPVPAESGRDDTAGGARFLGITGADLYLRRVEKTVLPLLPPGAILLNSQGRVIISRSARHVTGALLRRLDIGAADRAGAPVEVAGGGMLARCGRLGLYLLTPLIPLH
ncbi:cache domain-containing protein [Actinomadura sp. 9N407]|uniref:cache domain-containing protein n=1 Tax=Actinomadura sp. 9N407 TaxID=3375154 RepID=UPI0037A9C059